MEGLKVELANKLTISLDGKGAFSDNLDSCRLDSSCRKKLEQPVLNNET
jgi:hypothetical protein